MRPITFAQFASFAALSAALAGVSSLTPSAISQALPAPAASTSAPARAAATQQQPPPAQPALRKAAALQAPPLAGTETPAPEAAKAPGAEGVGVHGHWTIDVRNADGTVAEHRDFENSLQDNYDLYLIVTGVSAVGDLGIRVDTSGSFVCSTLAGTSGACNVLASSTNGLGSLMCKGTAAGICNYGLVETTDLTTGNITLSGMMPVLVDGSITAVLTQLLTCGNTKPYTSISPSQCYTGAYTGDYAFRPLTGAAIKPLNATAGQTISFTVVLSFS